MPYRPRFVFYFIISLSPSVGYGAEVEQKGHADGIAFTAW